MSPCLHQFASQANEYEAELVKGLNEEQMEIENYSIFVGHGYVQHTWWPWDREQDL